MLQIKNVTKMFDGKTIVDDVSIAVPTGSIALLLGASGVGKSTLLRMLAGLEQPDAGSILLDGKPLNNGQSSLQEHPVGMVFQQFNLFSHKSVKGNIMLPLEKVLKFSRAKACEQADALLAKFGLIDFADRPVSALSGGQKQRLALARTLAMRPKIICMDEPTSALDPILTAYVADLMMQLAREGYTVVVATHDTSILDKLDGMIYLMLKGKVVEAVNATQLAEPEQALRIKQFIAGQTE